MSTRSSSPIRGHTPICPPSAPRPPAETVTAIGFDVQHVPDLEGPLDPRRPLGEQRGWVRFTSAMCKPVLTRRPIIWAPGFHCADAPLVFDSLYLFHLHWADRNVGLQRLAKTRVMPWSSEAFGAHQRIADGLWESIFDGMASFPRREEVAFDPAFDPGLPPLSRLARPNAGQHGRARGPNLYARSRRQRRRIMGHPRQLPREAVTGYPCRLCPQDSGGNSFRGSCVDAAS